MALTDIAKGFGSAILKGGSDAIRGFGCDRRGGSLETARRPLAVVRRFAGSDSRKNADCYCLLAQNYDLLATVEEEFLARAIARGESKVLDQFQNTIAKPEP